MKEEVEAAKSPAARILEAANAYSTIADGIKNATEAADMAFESAEKASSMVRIRSSSVSFSDISS